MKKDFKTFFAKRLLEWDIGKQIGVSAIQLSLVLAIFLKTYFVTLNIFLYILLFVSILFSVWLLGFVLIHSGFYEKYQLHDPAIKRMIKGIECDTGGEDGFDN